MNTRDVIARGKQAKINFLIVNRQGKIKNKEKNRKKDSLVKCSARKEKCDKITFQELRAAVNKLKTYKKAADCGKTTADVLKVSSEGNLTILL